MHKIILIGNLGKDPEMRYTAGGSPVTSFSVAENRKYTKDGQVIEETTWFKISAWNKQAEACKQYLHKGSKVYVEGTLNSDKETGAPRIWLDDNKNPRTSNEVRAHQIIFLDSKSEQQPQTEETTF
jgi:single-strand DNA-binding protein